MESRIDLHNILCRILGSNNVYFQPPESVKINYPAIIYSREKFDTNEADNKKYILKTKYKITVVDKNPDSLIPGKIILLPLCSSVTNYKSNDLNHDVFEIYF